MITNAFKNSKLIFTIISTLSVIGLGFLLFTSPQQEAIDFEQLNMGIDIYRTNYCGSCHTLTIANTRGIFAPNHDNIIENATTTINSETYTSIAETVEDYISESIVDPAVFYTPGYESSNHHMPSFSHLSEEDLSAMVYMLMHQDAVDVSE